MGFVKRMKTSSKVTIPNGIIAPYMKKETERQSLSLTQKGLVIMDVFKGQMISDVNESLTKNHLCVVNVPVNMTTCFYQPLDVTVSGYCKKFLKEKFSNWYGGQFSKQLERRIKLDEAKIKLTLKPPHASWIIDFYNEMTSSNGMEITESGGWKVSGIQDTIKLGSKGLLSIDPFKDIDPVINDNEAANEANQLQAICALTAKEHPLGYSRCEEGENDDDDNDWEWEHDRGAFNALEDFLIEKFVYSHR